MLDRVEVVVVMKPIRGARLTLDVIPGCVRRVV
jgi:hypothetical protein